MEYGLWDQIRVDHGKEWCLMLYINGTLSYLRGNTSKVPHLQTSSTKVQCHTIISLNGVNLYVWRGREGRDRRR